MKASVRRVPRLAFVLVVSGALAALLWGGVRLQRIFVDERDTAKAAIVTRQRALEQYAVISLEKKLRSSLADARPRIDAALADPLQETADLLMVEDGKQLLPRLARYADGSAIPASDLYRALETDTPRGDGPWGERLALLYELRSALARFDDAAITASVRDVLNHESHFVVPVTLDIPYRIYLLDILVSRSTPDHALLQALLRDGLRGTQGRRVVGLQPLLILNRERFTRTDFEFLSNKVSTVSRKGRVLHDDFDARTFGARSQAVPIPAKLKTAAIIANGSWYAIPVEGSTVYGVAVDVNSILGDIASEMKTGGLLGASDTLGTHTRLAELVTIPELPVSVSSPSFSAEAAAIDRRYALKTATGIALGVLMLGVAALIGLLYWRERRYLEGKASFIATVSHELRTPIASLRLMGETLERRLEGVDVARDFPSRIVDEAERLSFLVENILSFNRLEKINVQTNLHSVSVAELVENARGDASAFTKKPVQVQVVEGAEIVLSADAELVKLLLSNLIANSCKYNGRDSVDISVRATRDAGRVVLRFSDNGTGIPPDEWESVFTEFVRSRNTAAHKGFGLGLALCRRIMQLHDGNIRITQSTEAGTTFEITFG